MLSGGIYGHLGERMVLKDQQSVQWHVRLLALALLHVGWSSEDGVVLALLRKNVFIYIF